MTKKKIFLILLWIMFPASFLAGESNQKTDDSKKIKIANVSLWVYYSDLGWDFSIIYRSGNWSASHYVPPERGKEEAKICDGVIVRGDEEDWPIGKEVYLTCESDRVDAEIAKGLNFDLKNPDPMLKGKAYIVINAIDGERRVYERPFHEKFKEVKTQQLNDTLMSQVTSCKK